MNWRLAFVATGCAAVLAGAAVASHRLSGEAPAAQRPPEPPLFAQAATGMPAQALWPRSGAVAYNEEMHALLTMAATPKVAARAAEPPPHRAHAQDPRERSSRRTGRNRNRNSARDRDPVEIEVRDRNGRRVRIERVEREAIDGYRARAYAPLPPAPPPRQGLPIGPFRLF
jgi:hypothetical protein